MTTKTITGVYAAGYTLKAAYYGLDIAKTAKVDGAGVRDPKTGAVANLGSVAAAGGATGVYMANGGTVTNGSTSASASITGAYGIVMGTTEPLSPVWSSVINHGYIGGRSTGVQIDEAGQLTNYGSVHGGGGFGFVGGGGATLRNSGTISGVTAGATINGGGTRIYNGVNDASALIKGTTRGVMAEYSESYVFNSATITGGTQGVYLQNGAQLFNGDPTKTGLIEGASGVFANSSSNVSNYATITGTGGAGHYGVKLGGGDLGNRAGGYIYGTTAVIVGAGGAVHNYGLIDGRGMGPGAYGVQLTVAGSIYNGAFYTGSVSPEIGGYEAVSILGGPGYVVNGGDIVSSGLHAAGVSMEYGGRVFNGAEEKTNALIAGAAGVRMGGAGTVTNYGTVQGSLDGGLEFVGGSVVNGAVKDTSALIEGYTYGVSSNGVTTIKNFGTISGANGLGVYSLGGSITNGSANDTKAVIVGVGGILAKDAAETVRNFGTVSGTGGYGIELLAGGSLTNGSATDTGALITGQVGVQIGGSTPSEVGAFTNLGTVMSSGIYDVVLGLYAKATNGSAGDTKALITNAVYVYGADTFTNFGTVGVNSYGVSVDFNSTDCTLVVESGSKFSGSVEGDGGSLDLASGAGTITLAGSAVTVSGSMAATAFSDFATVRVTAGASFKAAGNNTGILSVAGGTLTSDGVVSGPGHVDMNGGIADMNAGFKENVYFTGATGELKLGRSKTYTGKITGFSKTGGTSLDLLDIAFTGTTTGVYTGTTTSGVLTVTEGANTAEITLEGNYLSSTFTLSAAPGGGTLVVDPPKTPTRNHVVGPTPAHQFIAAMAGFGAREAGAVALDGALWRTPPPTLMTPRAQIA